MATQKSILIVGAGPSGLAALKEMRAVGLQATVVDVRSEYGGVFSKNSKVTFDNLYLTTPNMFMAFSDFPPTDKSMKYWSKEEYSEYLDNYVKHFALEQHIQLETKVEEASLDEKTKKWNVCFLSKGKHKKQETFDFLIVATGANHIPKIPQVYRGSDFSKIEIIHSSKYQNANHLKGKKVLVIGTGESAVDVAVSASKVATSTTIWGRSPIDLAPRFLDGYMNDPNYNEESYLLTQCNKKPGDILDSVTTTRNVRNMPLALWSACLHGLMYDIKGRYGDDSPAAVVGDLNVAGWADDFFSSDMADVPTKSAVLCYPASRGTLDIAVAPSISCAEKIVTFHKPSYFGKRYSQEAKVEREVDVIILCTGYNFDFSWLKAPVEGGPRSWFKHCFPPALADHMAFLGFARPHSGGIPQASEMLARYIALLQKLAGRLCRTCHC